MDKQNVTGMVQPYMGTTEGGNCLIGPYCPLGIVRIGPDATHPIASNNGYQPGDPIEGFSHTHVSGTGGAGRYGNIRVTPFVGAPDQRYMPPFLALPVKRGVDRIPENEHAELGYYRTTLNPWKVECELTATHQTGVHRYTFPEGGEHNLLLDAGACISSGFDVAGHCAHQSPWDSNAISMGGWIQQLNNHEFIGRSDFRGGWGHCSGYSFYFYFWSQEPFGEVRVTSEGGIQPFGEGFEAQGRELRCILSYGETKTVNLRVGISFVSVANAREAVERESKCLSFEEVRTACVSKWDKLLSRFRISGGTEEQRRVFYTSLYHLYVMPSDLGIDRENPHWQSGVRQFTEFYCLWDSIRNANSFFHLFDPALSRDMMNALLDVAEHTGWLPDAYIAHRHAYMQSACACDILFSEAKRKGVEGVDYEKALTYTRKNAEVLPPDVLVKGRYLEDYHTLGYLSTRVPKGSVSRHLEYTYHDWCIARLAEALGDEETAKVFDGYSERVWNLWNEEVGMFFPRNADGSWLEGYDPWLQEPEAWNSLSCYEGTTAVWSLNVFQDFYGLMERMGGREAFCNFLDRIFRERLFHIKETRMHIPHLYTYAGRPDRAAEIVRENLAEFSTAKNGLPDNEDMGCQSGYFLWQSFGLYPIYGQTHYMLTPPLFDRFEAQLDSGAPLVITAERKGTGKYIAACYLGEQAIDRAWLEHQELMDCRRLHFVLTDEPTDFGRENCPPNPKK